MQGRQQGHITVARRNLDLAVLMWRRQGLQPLNPPRGIDFGLADGLDFR